jgi:ABC-2 type transport system permease protein
MSKVWLIAQHQIRQEVSKRSFLLILFSLPLFLAVTVGLGYLASRLDEESVTLGYVDQADLLAQMPAEPEQGDVRLVPFDSPEAARAALEAGEVDAYYVLMADYATTRQAEIVYFEPPGLDAMRTFQDVVRLNLVADQPPAVADRLLSGANVTVRATENNRRFPDGGPGAGQFVPLIVAVIFAFLVLTTSGYMMEAVVEEKENRTVAIIVSSVSTTEMMTGKIMGALGIALMQLAVWLAFLVGAVWLGSNVLAIDWLQDITLNWRDLLVIVAIALPCYLFIAALTTLVGATLVESQEAQQVGPLLFILLLLPMYLLLPIIQHPNGPLSLGLSFFPVTSVMTVAFRSLFIEVPMWQVVLSAAIALGSGVVTVWLAGGAFRMSMLLYGKRLRWRDLFSGKNKDRPVRPHLSEA